MSDVAATAAPTALSAPPASPSSAPVGRSMWSHGSFSFKDLLDIVNPLQHLPVIGSVYRYLTGDEPAAGTRVIGDALYGGPIGFGVSVVSTALLTDSGGHDLGERLLADVFGARDHGDSPTLGTPQVATADGQPATPQSANQPAVASQVAGVTLPAKPLSYVPPARSVTAPPARSVASASAPTNSTPAAAAVQPSVPQALTPMPPQPVAMNQLYRSAPPVPPATPEQAFTAQASQFQHQISQGRGTNGAVLNNHPVPLELSSNLLPVMPAGGHLSLGPTTSDQAGQTNTPGAATSSQAQAAKPAGAVPDQKAIAQKMIDALNKYEQLKKQEEQQDNAEKANQAKLDLSL